MPAKKKDDWYTDEAAIQPHFDTVSRNYRHYWQEDTALGHLFRVRRRRVLELLASERRGLVLDVGCGPAVMGPSLARAGFRYYGVDLSEGMIRQAHAGAGEEDTAGLLVAKAQALPFHASAFDAITALGVLEYIPDRERAFAEFARLLRTGGVLVFCLQNRRSPYRVLERVMGTWIEPCPQFTPEEAVHFVERAGLEVRELVHYDFNVVPRPLDRRYPGITVKLAKRLEKLRRGPLRWLGTGFIVKAAKPRDDGPRSGMPGAPSPRR